MSKIRSWTIKIDEEEYLINFKRDIWFSKHKITVNGIPKFFETPFLQKVAGIADIPISLGEKRVHLVVSGRKVDLAMDGLYLESKKPYVPFMKIPGWAWVFFVLCIAIPIATLGGALYGAIAGVGVLFCIRTSILPNFNTFTKVFSCIGITALAWAITLFFMFVVFGSPFAGTYNLTSVSGIPGVTVSSYDYNYVELKSNGNYRIENKYNDITSSQTGTYKVEGDKITFITKSGGTTVREEYTIKNNKITIRTEFSGYNIVMVFTLEE